MPALALKNIPQALYERLKAAAEAHHRSLNGEAISCLEQVLKPERVSVQERIDRARRLRARIVGQTPGAEEIGFDRASFSLVFGGL